MHYFQQKGIGDSSLSKNILMQTLKPIQVTEHVMEASYYHKHENRRKCIWFQEAFIFSPRLQKRIFKTYWLLINYASAIHRTPAKPLNTKNVEVITSRGASTKAGPSAVGGHQYPGSRAIYQQEEQLVAPSQSYLILSHPSGCMQNEWSMPWGSVIWETKGILHNA